MPGPPPNPNARRRNAGSGFQSLPAAGRLEPAPPWPFRSDHNPFRGRRKKLWEQLWATPMALLWDAHQWTVPVARYVEMVLEYEEDPRAAPGTLLSEMRQAEQLLSMTTIGLLKSRASIEQAAPVTAAGAAGDNVVDLASRAAG